MLSATWAITAGTYGARFQRFCERYLDMGVGVVKATGSVVFEASDDPSAWNAKLDDAQRTRDLNFWKATLLRKFLELHREQRRRPPLRLILLQVVRPGAEVSGEEIRTGASASSPHRELRFGCGFAVVDQPADRSCALWYLRIQNHLRKMGLGRQALAAVRQAIGNVYESNLYLPREGSGSRLAGSAEGSRH